MEYLPTQPATPRPGEPLGIEDMVIYFANKEDRGIEGVVHSANDPMVMAKQLDAGKKTPVTRNMFLNAVYAMKQEAVRIIKV